LAQWEPSPATSVDVERDGNKTRAEFQKLSDRQNDIGPEALIFAKMPGLWGDSLSCDVAYRFTITGNKLVIIAERRPSGTVPFRLDAEILATNPKSPDTIRIQVFGPIKKDGSREIGSADFTYLKRGNGEELLWNDAVLGKQVRLTPCAVAKGRS
jgi:hypothetical protein